MRIKGCDSTRTYLVDFRDLFSPGLESLDPAHMPHGHKDKVACRGDLALAECEIHGLAESNDQVLLNVWIRQAEPARRGRSMVSTTPSPTPALIGLCAVADIVARNLANVAHVRVGWDVGGGFF